MNQPEYHMPNPSSKIRKIRNTVVRISNVIFNASCCDDVCPRCCNRCESLGDDRYRCVQCGYTWKVERPTAIPDPAPVVLPDSAPVVLPGDAAALIYSPTQDWGDVLQGQTLSTALERWTKEPTIWYATPPENFVFHPKNQAEEAEHILLILSNVKNYEVFQRQPLSRLAVERVLAENKESAVIRQIARISANDVTSLTLDWRKP